MTRIDLGVLELGTGAVNNGGTWWPLALDGLGAPEPRLGVLDLLGQDGATFSGETFLGPRAMTLRGIAKPSGGNDAYWLLRKLGEVVGPVSANVTLKVHESDYTKRCTVRRAGRIRHTITPGLLRFEVDLLAPDPRLYRDGQQSVNVSIPNGASQSDTVNATNVGTYPSPPDSIVLTGRSAAAAWLAVKHEGTDQQVRINTTLNELNDGEIITIDPQARTVVSSTRGNLYSFVDSTTRWWYLAPGSNFLRFRRDAAHTSTPTMTVNYRDSWL